MDKLFYKDLKKTVQLIKIENNINIIIDIILFVKEIIDIILQVVFIAIFMWMDIYVMF